MFVTSFKKSRFMRSRNPDGTIKGGGFGEQTEEAEGDKTRKRLAAMAEDDTESESESDDMGGV